MEGHARTWFTPKQRAELWRPVRNINAHWFSQWPLCHGVFNRSTQHLLILLEQEVCDGGDFTDMVHAAAEG